MNNRIHPYDRVFSLFILLALVTSACGLNMKSPVTNITTGPTQTIDVQVPLPEAQTGVELYLEFVSGDLKLSPGANGYLASGTSTFNVASFEPIVEANGASYKLRSGDQKIEGIPKFSDDFQNQWDLQLANTPMSLSINAGPYNGSLELGGLSLEKLTISEAGSNVNVAFSQPNQVAMSTFTYSTGGSTMVLKGLANANFEQMTFNSGAGDYTLSFDGDLQRDAKVLIDSGVSTLNIIVPQGVNARVAFDGGLSSVVPDAAWQKDGDTYTLPSSGHTIDITVKMGIGTLNLKNE